LIFFLARPRVSYAYIDPGSGSYFLQMLIGVFIGTLFAVRIYWAKIKSFFIGLFKKGDDHGREKDL
jgi:hypothetical protein